MPVKPFRSKLRKQLTDSQLDFLLNGSVMLTIGPREHYPGRPVDYPFLHEGHRKELWERYRDHLMALTKLALDEREERWPWYGKQYRPHVFWDFDHQRKILNGPLNVTRDQWGRIEYDKKPHFEDEEDALKRLNLWTKEDDELKQAIEDERERVRQLYTRGSYIEPV